jgi:hypothetical protein
LFSKLDFQGRDPTVKKTDGSGASGGGLSRTQR